MSTVPLKYELLDLKASPQSFAGIDILNAGAIERQLPTEVAFFRNTFRLNTAADETGLAVTGFDFIEEVTSLSDFWGRAVFAKIKITDPMYQIGHVYAFGEIAGSVIRAADVNRLQDQASLARTDVDGNTAHIAAIEKELDETPKISLAMEFETDLNGVVAYKDTAQATPVDGTGGTPVALSLVRSTDSPLLGTASAVIQKTSANAQGEGISKDFIIPRGVSHKPQKIEIVYETDGAYADGHIGLFLYDKTNANFIPVSVQAVPASYGKPATFLATFTPSTSTQYRWILHVATNTTTAWNFKLDDVQVSDKNMAIGAAISEWQSFPLSIDAVVVGTGGTSGGRWRRVGSNMEIQGHFIFGSSGFNMPASTMSLNLPNGYTVDSSRVSRVEGYQRLAGNAQSYDYSTNISYLAIPILSPNGKIAFITHGTSVVVATSPFTWAAQDEFYFNVSVPIAQWTSNVNLASDFTEYAYNSSTTTTDDHTSFGQGIEGAMFQAFAPAGVTAVNKRVRFKNIQQGDLIIVEVMLDGFGWLPTYERSLGPQENDAGTTRYGIHSYQVNATDIVVQFFSRQNKVPSNTWSAISNLPNRRWRVRKISNGNMAEVPPLVRAEYTGISAQGAGIPLNYSTKMEDSHTAVTVGAAWKFTAPFPGVYRIMHSVASSTTVSSRLMLYKNGVPWSDIGITPAAIGVRGFGNSSIRLSAGDFIDVRSFDYGVNAGVSDRIIIERIGS